MLCWRAQVYARRQRHGREALTYAEQVEVEALHKLGEQLRAGRLLAVIEQRRERSVASGSCGQRIGTFGQAQRGVIARHLRHVARKQRTMKTLGTIALFVLVAILGTGCTPAGLLMLDTLAAARAAHRGYTSYGPAPLGGTAVYSASQCIGPVIMGVCQGSVVGLPAARCYGTMLNGQCTGPMF